MFRRSHVHPISNYWTRLSKIVVSGEQINLSFEHRVFFFEEYLREAKRSAIFTQKRSQEGEKRGFIYA